MHFKLFSLFAVLVTVQDALATSIEARQNPQQIIETINGLKAQSDKTKTSFKDLTMMNVFTTYQHADGDLDETLKMAGAIVTIIGREEGEFAKERKQTACNALVSLATSDTQLVRVIISKKETLQLSFNYTKVQERLRVLNDLLDRIALTLINRASCSNQVKQKFQTLQNAFYDAEK